MKVSPFYFKRTLQQRKKRGRKTHMYNEENK